MSYLRSYKFIAVFVALACLCSFFATQTVHAQQVTTTPDISLTAIPLNPAPGQTVTISAQSLSVDLSLATESWTYGGKPVSTGVGMTKLVVIAPAAGNTALVSVTVSGTGIASATASVLLNPASIDMLWEATDAYTPPFYKGKALLPVQGAFRVVAIPAPNSPRSMSFVWTRNGDAVQSATGLNKNSITLENTIFNKQESIAASAYGGSFRGDGSVVVPTVIPTVVGYQKKEGFIDYIHGSTRDIAINTAGTTLRFEPYFFSVKTGTIFDTVQIGLTVDDQPVAGDPVANELRISRPENGGTHKLGIDISTIAYSVQHITKVFNILFQ